MCDSPVFVLTVVGALVIGAQALAAVGDPQIMTDHPYFQGELSCSTMDRTIATAYEQYRQRTGSAVQTDQDRALALWFWRATHFWHTEPAYLDYWDSGFLDGQEPTGGDMFPRDYWLGTFSQGSVLCGAAHSQFSALVQSAFGPGTARTVGVVGHNSHEAWLTGGLYGQGQWVVLDTDMSIIVFDEQGERLCSMLDVVANPKLLDATYKPDRQHGWPLSGMGANGASGTLKEFRCAEYNPGYLGAPPMLYLPDGMTFRRYPEPGLGGKTYCFWGANYAMGDIPGPARDRTWAKNPAAMYKGPRFALDAPGPTIRYGNGVFTYRPDFVGGGYTQAVVDESDTHVTFELSSPYLIACTPVDADKWAVYKPGATNGLVLTGKAKCSVALSVDGGATWRDCGPFRDGLDLTDVVKGRRQYRLRLGASASTLAASGLVVRTVVQINPTVFPHLTSDGCGIRYQASNQGIKSVGPFINEARTHLVEGRLGSNVADTPGSSRVVMRVATPRGEPITAVHVAAHVWSKIPPNPDVRYQIEASLDGGKTWRSIVKDWRVVRREPEPKDFWSQGFVWGSAELGDGSAGEALVRFSNDGDVPYCRTEVHLAYAVGHAQPLAVRYGWTDTAGSHTAEHLYEATDQTDVSWQVPTGKGAVTRWVEFEPVAAKPR